MCDLAEHRKKETFAARVVALPSGGSRSHSGPRPTDNDSRQVSTLMRLSELCDSHMRRSKSKTQAFDRRVALSGGLGSCSTRPPDCHDPTTIRTLIPNTGSSSCEYLRLLRSHERTLASQPVAQHRSRSRQGLSLHPSLLLLSMFVRVARTGCGPACAHALMERVASRCHSIQARAASAPCAHVAHPATLPAAQ